MYGPMYYIRTNVTMPVSCCPEQDCDISIKYEGCLLKLLSTPIYSLIIIYIIQAIIFCLQVRYDLLLLTYTYMIIYMHVSDIFNDYINYFS